MEGLASEFSYSGAFSFATMREMRTTMRIHRIGDERSER